MEDLRGEKREIAILYKNARKKSREKTATRLVSPRHIETSFGPVRVRLSLLSLRSAAGGGGKSKGLLYQNGLFFCSFSLSLSLFLSFIILPLLLFSLGAMSSKHIVMHSVVKIDKTNPCSNRSECGDFKIRKISMSICVILLFSIQQ